MHINLKTYTAEGVVCVTVKIKILGVREINKSIKRQKNNYHGLKP